MRNDPVGASGHRLTTSTFRWLVPVQVLERPWARRLADDGHQVTLVARRTDGLGDLADNLQDTGPQIDTMTEDAADPERLGARLAERHSKVHLGSSSTTQLWQLRTN